MHRTILIGIVWRDMGIVWRDMESIFWNHINDQNFFHKSLSVDADILPYSLQSELVATCLKTKIICTSWFVCCIEGAFLLPQ